MRIGSIQNNVFNYNRYNQSFTADLKERINVRKRTDFDTFEKTDAAIVTFDTDNPNDGEVLKDASLKWPEIGDKKSTFATDVYVDFCQYKYLADGTNETQFIGVTSQKDNFEKMDSSKVLGLAEVSHFDKERYFYAVDSDGYMLELLQTIPTGKYNAEDREYKDVGQNLLDYVIKEYSSKPLLLVPTQFAEPFYKKNGFEDIPGLPMMIYTGKKSD